MKSLLNPKWIFLINTLPVMILFCIAYGDYQVINSLLNEDHVTLWKYFSTSLLLLTFINFIYAIYTSLNKKKVSVWYSIFMLCASIAFLYIHFTKSNELIPWGLPRWMFSGNIMTYIGTFLMPTLVYSLLQIVIKYTPKSQQLKAWKNLLVSIAIPLSIYLFTLIIGPLWRLGSSPLGLHAVIIILVAATLIFLFFLTRFIYILVINKKETWIQYAIIWKIPVTVIMPLVGLQLNNNEFHQIFGDFSNLWFYILAAFNGIVLCLPNKREKWYRLSLFMGRVISFTYTLYFFVVFLPFLPFSIAAVIVFGAGFLMLTPLVLFVIHTNQLWEDFKYLGSHYSKNILIGSIVVGSLLIPSYLSVTYYNDRETLHQVLDYVYTPNYDKTYTIDTSSVSNTLNIIANNKESSRGIFNSQQPYLSSYFNWLVLDNLTLSDQKINDLQRIFLDKSKTKTRQDQIRNHGVDITKIDTESKYDKQQKVWRSWINLQITNNNESLKEYATTIELPQGTWISDYYLFVNGVKEPGLLAEKKSAQWVFSSIRNQNRDPGILYYLTGNKVAFRVFPFLANEIRQTGIELLHKEPISLRIDGHELDLGKLSKTSIKSIETKEGLYISPKAKSTLKKVKRKPYFHFLLDGSSKKQLYEYKNLTKKILSEYPNWDTQAKFTIIDHQLSTVSLNDDWRAINIQGGFFLERGIKKALFENYKEEGNTYPVIVALTENMNKAIFLDEDLADWQFTFPDLSNFYSLNTKGEICKHSLINNPLAHDTVALFKEGQKVLPYHHQKNTIAYLKNDNKPSLILKAKPKESSIEEVKNWESALNLQLKWQRQILYPSDDAWLKLVKESFKSRIMTPVTSYLVVENEAQKATLLKKQNEVLSGNKSLDLGEDTLKMSEPELWIILLLLGLMVRFKSRRF